MSSLSPTQIDRLSKALRENLLKRKAQKKLRAQKGGSLPNAQEPFEQEIAQEGSAFCSPKETSLR